MVTCAVKVISVPVVQGIEESDYPRQGCQAVKSSLRDRDFRPKGKDSRTGQGGGEGRGGAGCSKMGRKSGPRNVLRLRVRKLREHSVPAVCGGRVGV